MTPPPPPEDFAFSRRISGVHRIPFARRAALVLVDCGLAVLFGAVAGSVLARCW